jgi:RNA polymerase sigma factor (sigma-70 family)
LTGIPALYTRHLRVAHAIARDFYWPGAEPADVVQEARIGLWVACREYDREKGHGNFPAFAKLVIRRRLASCVKHATLPKRGPLDDSIREVELEDGPAAIADVIPGGADPADVVVAREEMRELLGRVAGLTPLERRCVIGVATGHAYEELGDPKVVDNAIARARTKLRGAK